MELPNHVMGTILPRYELEWDKEEWANNWENSHIRGYNSNGLTGVTDVRPNAFASSAVSGYCGNIIFMIICKSSVHVRYTKYFFRDKAVQICVEALAQACTHSSASNIVRYGAMVVGKCKLDTGRCVEHHLGMGHKTIEFESFGGKKVVIDVVGVYDWITRTMMSDEEAVKVARGLLEVMSYHCVLALY